MERQLIGIKELHKQLSQIIIAVSNGQSFLVVKNSKPAFRIEPPNVEARKKYNLSDLKKIQFKSRDKNLSKKIDNILY